MTPVTNSMSKTALNSRPPATNPLVAYNVKKMRVTAAEKERNKPFESLNRFSKKSGIVIASSDM